MILGIAEAVVVLLAIVTACVSVLIVVRMSLGHERAVRVTKQAHDYQMQLLSNDHEQRMVIEARGRKSWDSKKRS